MRLAFLLFLLLPCLLVVDLAKALDVQQEDTKLFHTVSRILPNGLEVIILPMPRAPVAAQYLYYKVGGMDDPVGKSGLAHLLEHLMFKGTRQYEAGQFSATVARLGGRDNAFTSQDVTAYHQIFPAEHLQQMMKMEADRMRNLDFTQAGFHEAFLKERNVVIEERAQRTDNNPAAKLREQINPAFYLNHPYRKPIIGWAGELESLMLEDAKAFYDRYYHPNNAILVLVGDIDSQQAMEWAEKYYGQHKSSALAPMPVYGNAELASEISIRYMDPLVKVAQWRYQLPAPSIGELFSLPLEKARQAYKKLIALEIGLKMIAGGASSPLYRKLAVDQPLAVQVGGYLDVMKRGPGTIHFYLVPRNSQNQDQDQNENIKDAVAAFHQALTMIRADGFLPDDFERARQKMLDETELQMDRLPNFARLVGGLRSVGLPLSLIENWPVILQEITMEEVEQALNLYLNQAGKVESWLLPTPNI